MESTAQLKAKASWRVAVSQGLTLLGFRDWVIECTDYPREVCDFPLAQNAASEAETTYRRRDLRTAGRRQWITGGRKDGEMVECAGNVIRMAA